MSGGSDSRVVAVLGGGFMGLNLARLLDGAGYTVTLYESAETLGGVSASFELDRFTVDRFYHTILPGDTALLGVIDELGLTDHVSWRKTETGFFKGSNLYGISNVLEFLRFPVLSPLERLRLGFTLFRAQRFIDWESIRHLTCEEWLTRTCGRSVYEKLWQPLLKGKLGEAAPEVSASFIWATMTRLQDAKHGDRVSQSDSMGFLRGGYGVLIDGLIRHLDGRDVTLRTNCPIDSLASTDVGWRVESGSHVWNHEAVISTLPPSVLDRLTSGRGVTLETAGNPVRYLGVVVEVLLIDEPLSPYYILNLGESDLSFTGVIEMTNLAPPGYFEGRSLVYLPRYTAPGDSFIDLSDGEVRNRFHPELTRVFPRFGPERVVASSIQRAPFVQPIHTVDYLDRIPPMNPAPGLWTASSAQVHPWPLNNDRIVRQAERVVEAFQASGPAPMSGAVTPPAEEVATSAPPTDDDAISPAPARTTDPTPGGGHFDRTTVIYLAGSIVLGLAGHSLLKVGAEALEAGGAPMGFMDLVQATLLNPILMLGLILYATGTFSWLLVLSRADLAVAYPYTGLNYVLVLLPSVIFLGERVGMIRILGMLLIAFGVFIHSRTVSRTPEVVAPEKPALTRVGSP